MTFTDAAALPIAQLLPSRQDFDEHAPAETDGPGGTQAMPRVLRMTTWSATLA